MAEYNRGQQKKILTTKPQYYWDSTGISAQPLVEILFTGISLADDYLVK